MATAHWRAVAPPAHVDAYVWVVTRHEIDYLRALGPGESVTGRTWVGEAPKGARFDRHVEFIGDDGKLAGAGEDDLGDPRQGDRAPAARPAPRWRRRSSPRSRAAPR